MSTIATLFSGFGGVDIGAIAAGLTPIWGNEFDYRIADIYRQNVGDHVITCDVLDLEPHQMVIPDVLHASPPCTNASQASGGKPEEQQADIDYANKIAQFISVMQPKIFTLENVWFYRNFKSWHIICNALYRSGYMPVVDHINCADYGVPQTRKRMIVRAVHGAMVPHLPPADQWISWYEAIADLLDDLPDTKLAGWQLDMLPDGIMEDSLIGDTRNGNRDVLSMVGSERPAMTVTSSNGKNLKAFLIGAQRVGKDRDELQVVEIGNPAMGVTTKSVSQLKAFLSRGVVKKITQRCLARFQSFPDSYRLPDQATLAGRGIGNAVPPMVYQKIIGQLLEVTA